MKTVPFVARSSITLSLALLLAPAALAQVKNCEVLRGEIAARMPLRADQALRIVDRDAAAEGVVHGSCEGGTRRIVLVSGVAATQGEAVAPASPVAPVVPVVPVVPAMPEPAAPPPVPPSQPAAGVTDTVAQYRTWIAEARAQHPYPESEDHMFSVMMCESRGNARITSPAGNIGLFQYAADTWRRDWNPYKAADVRDARSQIFATARAWELRYQRWWPSCYARFRSPAPAPADL